MSPLLTIAKREFRSYFDSPLAYVVICLSFFALGLMSGLSPRPTVGTLVWVHNMFGTRP